MFSPATISSGGTSTLSFTLSNPSGIAVSGVGFTATLSTEISLSNISAGSCGGTNNYTANTLTVSGISLGVGVSCTISANATATTPGTYTSSTGPLSSAQFGSAGVGRTATLTVTNGPANGSYIYNLPLLANNANTALGQTTTYITFQNLSDTSSATVNVQYYSIIDGNSGPSDGNISIPAKGQKAILPNIPTGSSYGGVVTSNQPLNLVVSESLNNGGSAYNVAASTASTLYSPLALNGQYNFVTNIIVFNAASTGTSSGTIQFFDEAGNSVPGATKTFSVPAHASQTFNQSSAGSGLVPNHAYWAKIMGTTGSQLTAQVIEFGPANFVATFNALVPAQLKSTLYAPAAFNGQFNFVTGMALANPNGTAASVTINYYDANGLKVFSQANLSVAANGVIGVYQPGVNGLPSTISSATIISSQPLIMAVNERGPGTISGTYVGLAIGNTNVALPVMAKGFAGFLTGSTVLNVGSSSATLTFTYVDQSGAQVGNPQTKTLEPNASFLVYQGGADQGLPAGFFGTALISSNQPLLVTTNALNTNSGLFYTYTEPSN